MEVERDLEREQLTDAWREEREQGMGTRGVAREREQLMDAWRGGEQGMGTGGVARDRESS